MIQNVVKVVLVLAIAGLTYYLYEIIQEPIRFERIKEKRYTAVKARLENIRDAQKAYRSEFNNFAKNFDDLIAFVDTGKSAIVERKDSSFMKYDERYMQDMRRDTVIVTILGYRDVKKNLFGEDFDASQLRYIPFTEKKEFIMQAGRVEANKVNVAVFEAKAPNEVLFADILDEYEQFIDKDYALAIGSLNEPSLSGNWK